MVLYNRRSIRAAGTTLHFPPYNAGNPVITPIIAGSDPIPIPFAGSMVTVYRRRVGWRILYSFQMFEETTAVALAFHSTLIGALFDDDGIPRSVDFCDWYDSDNTLTKIYRDCELVSLGPDGGRFEKFKRYDLEFISKNNAFFSTFTDTTTPGVGPYADDVTGPLPAEEDPEEGDVYIVPTTDTTILGGTFAGSVEVTASGIWQHIFTGMRNTAFAIKAVRITGCSIAGGGTTTIRASSAAWDGGGSYITATVGTGATSGTLVTGSVALAANASVYVYITGANGHAGLSYQVILEST
jgi:hypothetical protein